jgi:hypothetical protein
LPAPIHKKIFHRQCIMSGTDHLRTSSWRMDVELSPRPVVLRTEWESV